MFVKHFQIFKKRALSERNINALFIKCFKNEDKRFAKYSISWRQSIIRVNLFFGSMGWDVDINFHNADVNIIFHYADIIKHYADHFSHFQSPLAFRADFGLLSLSGQVPGQFLH